MNSKITLLTAIKLNKEYNISLKNSKNIRASRHGPELKFTGPKINKVSWS